MAKKKRRTDPGLTALARIRAATKQIVDDHAYRASGPPWSQYQWQRSDARVERLRRAIKRNLAKLDAIAMQRRFEERCSGEQNNWRELIAGTDRLQANIDGVLACCAQFPGNLATLPWSGDVAMSGFALAADALRIELREPVRC
jgi:hypothetical protein